MVNQNVFGWIDFKVEDYVVELNDLDNMLANRNRESISKVAENRAKLTQEI